MVERQELNREHELYGLGNDDGDAITFRLVFDESTVLCRKHDHSRYRNNWPTPVP